MKKHNPQDERVAAQRQKIYGEALGILMVALFGSMLVQQFFLDASFSQYATEFICFLGTSIYMIIRYMMLGLNIYGEGKWSKAYPVGNSIVTGIVVTTINGVLNYIQNAERYRTDGIGYFFAMLAITFISVTILVFAVQLFFGYLNKKNQARIQTRLDEDEQEE